MAELRQLGAAKGHRARRQFLKARNGRLTDAMLTWRPDAHTGCGPPAGDGPDGAEGEAGA
ncbi:hypothetical protein [Egicoccus sp. AB-alg6-2]|uniref:hypothetical protein n=1 Tax=Egicoccus sp. AB-alg6-2 TaxID=3242692 RepID=UPI00359CC75F